MLRKKLVSLVLAIVLASTFAIMPAYADPVETNIGSDSVYWDYVQLYFQKIEGCTVSLENSKILLSCSDSEPVAILFLLTSGYAIFRLDGNYICEYSLEGESPYAEVVGNQPMYYDGPFEYYILDNDSFVHTRTGESFSAEHLQIGSLHFSSISSNNINSLQGKIAILNSFQKTRAIEQSNSLSRSLSTAWVNGYCGPTSAHAMLKYRSLVESGYSSTDLIYRIATYTNKTVSLSSLKNGMNNYLSQAGFSKRVASMNYSFSKVVSEINAGRPLTLGTNGGGLADGGHVQTIHGYHRQAIGTSINYYTLYVNNSWGKNNVAISYEDYVPSYLKDHVYFTS